MPQFPLLHSGWGTVDPCPLRDTPTEQTGMFFWCENPLEDLAGRMIFNTCGHLQGKVGAGDEGGLLPAGPSTDHVVTAAVWGTGGQAGRQAHSGGWAECWEAPPLRRGLFVGVDAVPLALLIAPCGACEAWRWAGHLVIEGHRDAPAASATRGPGLSGEAGPPPGHCDECAGGSVEGRTPCPGSQLPPKCPEPVLFSGNRIWRACIQMSSCQSIGRNTLFELDEI